MPFSLCIIPNHIMRILIITAVVLISLSTNFAFSKAFEIKHRSLKPEVRDLGINCRGSWLCTKSHADLLRFIQWVPPDRVYSNGQHIVCDGHFCAFLQDTNDTFYGVAIRELLKALLSHCDNSSCGSIPTEWPESFDPRINGILTVNYVKKPECQGICPNDERSTS